MHSNEPFTARQRQGVLAFFCALPAFCVGFYFSGFALRIGSHLDFVAVLKRGGVCAIPAALFAFIFPRYWLVPSILYGLGFHYGYAALPDSISAGMAVLFAGIFGSLTSGRAGGMPGPSHSELLGIYLIALWVAAFVSMLRLQFERKAKATHRVS